MIINLEINLYLLIVTIVSFFGLVLVGRIAIRLFISHNEASREYAKSLLGTCIEIILATIALYFFGKYVYVWIILKLVGRIAEIVAFLKFQRYLNTEKTGKKDDTQIS